MRMFLISTSNPPLPETPHRAGRHSSLCLALAAAGLIVCGMRSSADEPAKPLTPVLSSDVETPPRPAWQPGHDLEPSTEPAAPVGAGWG